MFFRKGSGSCITGVFVFVLFASCSVYDRLLIETEEEGVIGGGKEESGGGGTVGDSGSGGKASGGAGGNTNNVDEFGYGEPDSSVEPDNDVGDVCGDGRVTGSELCDVGVNAGLPGACPSTCPEPDGCAQWQLVGGGCQAECQPKTPDCQNGDNCCPSKCTNATDSDCSASCGDGVVQAEEGELCEPRTALEDNPDVDALACPTQCDDDGDPCTLETLTGSEDNCNAQCSRTEIAAIVAGDGCCPEGANANTDSDCQPICGNKVREGDEECDGADSCDDQCKSTLTPEQRTCFEVDDIHVDECKKCVCTNCTQQTLLCLNSGDSTFDEKCSMIVECGEQNACVGTYCYCGTALDPVFQTCVVGAPANGPCKSVIEEAAGTNNIVTIWAQQADPNVPVGRAFLFGSCYETNCLDICR
ncbi:MAG: hypothetical protein JXA30_16775 [Deltaproteobacteria bacterium]|nr:hypothetical protein [Deltaproteobacteria bacterium]